MQALLNAPSGCTPECYDPLPGENVAQLAAVQWILLLTVMTMTRTLRMRKLLGQYGRQDSEGLLEPAGIIPVRHCYKQAVQVPT